jgi:hypothetical protein
MGYITETHFSNQSVNQEALIKAKERISCLGPPMPVRYHSKPFWRRSGARATQKFWNIFQNISFSEALNTAATERKVSRTSSYFNTVKCTLPPSPASHPTPTPGVPTPHSVVLCVPVCTLCNPVAERTRLTFICASQVSWCMICSQ